MCDPDICQECRDCNPIETADCPGCFIKSKRLKCMCREAYPEYSEVKEEYQPVHVMCGIRDIIKELMEKIEKKGGDTMLEKPIVIKLEKKEHLIDLSVSGLHNAEDGYTVSNTIESVKNSLENQGVHEMATFYNLNDDKTKMVLAFSVRIYDFEEYDKIKQNAEQHLKNRK